MICIVFISQGRCISAIIAAIRISQYIKNSNIDNLNKATDLVYIMYTSGSTGKPKGIMIEHRNVVRLVKNSNYIDFYDDDKILQTGAFSFDASTFEIWGSLLNGLELYLVNIDTILDINKLDELIKIKPDKLVDNRIEKFGKMGVFTE